MEKELIKTYPFNLINAIFRNEDLVMLTHFEELKTTLGTLSEREQKVLDLRFREKLTLQACVPILGVTRERIRQIEAKALRKLRHPVRANRLLSISMATHRGILKEKDELYEDLAIKYENLKVVYESTSNQKVDPDVMTGLAEKAKLLEQPIEELELSVRSYNCLKRKGKNKVKDITSMTLEELSQVRNLGRKSMEEVLSVLEYKGLELRKEVEEI